LGKDFFSQIVTNLFMQNVTGVSTSLEIPQVEVTPLSSDTGSGHLASTAETPSATPSSQSRVPLPSDSHRDLSRMFSSLPNSLRVSVSTSSGTETVIIPKGTPLAEIQNLISSLTSRLSTIGNQDVLANPAQPNVPAASALAFGSHAVFAPETPTASPLSFLGHAEASLAGNGPSTLAGRVGEGFLAAQGMAAAPQNAAATAGRGELPAARPSANLESIKISEVVRDVLVRLEILPPGVSTEEALPRLQEIFRLWTAEGAQKGDLPAEVVRVVSNFLASAVLATALPGGASVTDGAEARLSPEAQAGFAGGTNSPLFAEGTRPDFRFGPLTRNDIAKAVMSALTGAPFTPQAPLSGRAFAPGQSAQQGSDAPRFGTMLPPSPAGSKADEKDAANVRLSTMVRTDAGPDRASQSRDGKANTRLTGDEHRERTEASDVDPEKRRAAHDQESHAGSGTEEDAHAVEALWGDLHAALDRAGFVSETGSLRALHSAEEGRDFLNIIAPRVPNGWDLIDALGLVDARMGLAPEAGAVNAALHRLAGYRTRWKNDKVRAVLEPLHDAFVELGLLDLVETGQMGRESIKITHEDLKGFETHVAAVQLIVDRPEWISRIGDDEDRGEIKGMLPDVELLVENAQDKLFVPLSRRPEYFAETDPALAN
jgi:hypothetical protein